MFVDMLCGEICRSRSLAWLWKNCGKVVKNICLEKCAENQETGKQWIKVLIEKPKKISFVKTSKHNLSRSTSIHKLVIMFCNCEEALQRTYFTPIRIFNLRETSIITVVEAHGSQHEGQCVSTEEDSFLLYMRCRTHMNLFCHLLINFPKPCIRENKYRN